MFSKTSEIFKKKTENIFTLGSIGSSLIFVDTKCDAVQLDQKRLKKIREMFAHKNLALIGAVCSFFINTVLSKSRDIYYSPV